MTGEPAWVAAAAGSTAALFAGLSYRLIRRQSKAVPWSIEVFDDAGIDHVAFKNETAARALSVIVEDTSGRLHPIAVSDDVDAGGRLVFLKENPMCAPAASSRLVTINWKTRWGRRRVWRSVLV